MNHFLLTMTLVPIVVAALGWSTHLAHQRGGPATERKFHASLSLMLAGLFLFLALVANYYLASTSLGRLLGRERIGQGDPLGALLFKGSGIHGNHLLGLIVVAMSFLSAGWFLRCLGQLLAAVRVAAWRTQPHQFGVQLATFALSAIFVTVALRLDTSLLLFRTATMLWSGNFAGRAASMPSPDRIQANVNYQGTMGAYLMAIFAWWYPLYILMAEKHFASCWARHSEACREAAAERAGIGMPAAPVGAPPFVMPPAAPAAPAPGGAAPWVRPVPVNPGAPNGNGHPDRG